MSLHWGVRLILYALCILGLIDLPCVVAFANNRSDNLAVYWGQDAAGHQRELSFYCQDDTIDIIPLAFLYVFFGEGGKPVINLANICSPGGKEFANSDLVDCSFMASDIKQCQAKGKKITLSLGGATAKVGFKSKSQAEDFAKDVWDMFLGGRSNTRPFGQATLDGIDLDIENGSSSYYSDFVNKIRSLSKGLKKRYYITAAPQCPFPDAKVGDALNKADFDAVYVQFYNNYCEASSPSAFNFDTWDEWAKTKSPNPDVKVYIGAPAGPKAASSGYVDANALIKVAKDARKKYSSFGGVMLWDADMAYNNDKFHVKIKKGISTGPPTIDDDDRADEDDRADDDRTDDDDRTNDDDRADDNDRVDDDDRASVSPAKLNDFEDPRATARVKRPSITINQRDVEPTNMQPRVSSRWFRL
ncbi:hypothetical protein AGABI1DRAFT_103656 [Agaricus bisporus var. burnettii JB137-S8]|uniref:chitinase n=1 Tax=Agaricus bisporus var. burnettii (strain JB137-S8 / ATCC MYA-4627 / FGSC 10392) TaxID=597362 RepID=K5X6E7_AGABU|nr:uncharacterized protein AGABI1DRAFT_103656 [Agaricus bisporus var. burnettii JB137-S8]EKM83456.1 hypothetical protein AGABI1DRAFT_103656 [Agaricus bisporus var. burnettii JB137-S8]